jgi:hypothetical protein
VCRASCVKKTTIPTSSKCEKKAHSPRQKIFLICVLCVFAVKINVDNDVIFFIILLYMELSVNIKIGLYGLIMEYLRLILVPINYVRQQSKTRTMQNE